MQVGRWIRRLSRFTGEKPGSERAAGPAGEPDDETPSPRRRYGWAAISALLAVAARLLLARVFRYHHPYVTFYVAVLWSGWYGGLGPALLATGLGAAATVFFILPSERLLGSSGEGTLVGFEFYFIVTLTAAILFEAQKRAARRSALNARIARDRLSELEREIDRRRAAEEAASAVEEQFRLTVEHAPVGICRLTSQGGFLEVNPQFCKILGYSREELLRLSFRDVIHPDDLEAVMHGYRRFADGEIPFFSVEKRHVRKDGSVIWTATTAAALRDTEEHPRHILAVVQDITSRKRAEEQLREAQKLESIGLLAGGIAHDFNNLLTGVLGNASLALDMISASSQARQMLQGVIEAAERAARLTSQLLAYAGKGNFAPGWIDLSEAARRAIENLRPAIPGNVDLRFTLARDLPRLYADAAQIKQLVSSLVMNGVEALEDNGGRVEVRTGLAAFEKDERGVCGPKTEVGQLTQGEYLFVRVEDTGAGMDESTVHKIFDPFFTTKFMGRGLGLAAVAGLVRAQKGAVAVNSQPSRGTIIQVFFPVGQYRGEPARPGEVFERTTAPPVSRDSRDIVST